MIVCFAGHPLRDAVERANATPYCPRCARERSKVRAEASRRRAAERRAKEYGWISS